jgi:hypothetical protein
MNNGSDKNIIEAIDISIAKFDVMFDPIESTVEKTSDGYIVRYITVDKEPESPRQCDNFGKMVCFHGKYNLGDENDYRGENFNSWDELRDEIVRNESPVVIFPLYLYDHSGISMRTHPFSDIWDSGQVGFIFVSEEKIREEFSIGNNDIITDEIIENAKKILKGEVILYDNYLTGRVYRLVKEKFDKDRKQLDYEIKSGYYGMENAREDLKTF